MGNNGGQNEERALIRVVFCMPLLQMAQQQVFF